VIRWNTARTLTYNATSLILQNSEDRTTAIGDVGIYEMTSAGAREISYLETATSTAVTHGYKMFTANGTFTVPTGITQVKVTCVGGAGGGGGGSIYSPSGTGGTGATGYVNSSIITVTAGQSIAITIGAGGTLGATSTSSSTGVTGSTGGTTYFGSLLSAPGGPGGTGGTRTGDSDGYTAVNGTNGFSYSYRYGIFYTRSVGGTGGYASGNLTPTVATAGTAGLCIVEY